MIYILNMLGFFEGLLENLLGIVAFIFVLGLIILVHEGGHFLFARRVNILCREFAFGMGPQLVKKQKGETVYSIRAFPIGGFCAIAGEELEEDPFKGLDVIGLEIKNKKIVGFYFEGVNPSDYDVPRYKILNYDIYDLEQTGRLYMNVEANGEAIHYEVDPQAILYDKKVKMQIAPYNRTVGSKKKRDRALVMFGGPLLNFILALIVFLIAGLMTKFPNYDSNVLNEVADGTAAYYFGLREDDKITGLKFESQSGSYELAIETWRDLESFMNEYRLKGTTSTIDVTYIRDGAPKTISLKPQVIINTLAMASDYKKTDKVVVGAINNVEDTYIKNTDLLVGDEILRINDKQINSWNDVVVSFNENVSGSEMQMSINRDGDLKTITVKPYSHEMYKLGVQSNNIIFGNSSTDEVEFVRIVMGVSPVDKFYLGESIKYGFVQTGNSFTVIFVTFRALFASNEVNVASLSGPIGIFSITKQVAAYGFVYLLNLIGMLSVNVGLLNLLPIPALDGGRLVFLGYEAITKKKPNPKVETILITITMILLFGLMIIVAFNDILRIFK